MSLPASITGRRRRRLLGIGAAGVVLLGLMGLSALTDGPQSLSHPKSGTPVVATNVSTSATRIAVRLADGGYELVNSGAGWRMDHVRGYPVRTDRIGALLVSLSELSWAEPRTSDPRKHDRLGLGDPDAGGTGAEVRIYDEAGETLAGFILGRRNETLYLREPGDALAFRVEGDLPPLQNPQSWMDFQVIAIVPDAIAGVILTDGSGERLHLTRPDGGGPRDFVPAPGFDDNRLVNRLAAATPSLALSRFAPLSVKPITDLTTEPVARHITLTKDGLEVIADAFEEADGPYLTIRAVEAAEGAHRAEDVNSRADGWAFKLSRYDWTDFTVPVSDIVERPIVALPGE
ncbi:MAG: DUF4340 domain-containing protein [Pseudomonadota bacterium]